MPLDVVCVVGVNVTFRGRFWPGLRFALPLKPVTPKGADPVTPVIVMTVLPLFATVTVCAGLVVFKSWFPKLNDVGVTFNTVVGKTPVPERDTEPFPLKVSLVMLSDPE